jgi:hypothetical protein
MRLFCVYLKYMKDSEQSYNIGNALDATLKTTDLQNVAFDFAEIGLDNLLENGVLRDLPVVSFMVSLMKTGANVNDFLFLKKILGFLNPIKEVSIEKRKRLIEKIDNSKKYRIRVGEKLLYIIDSCEDFEIAYLMGELFKCFLEGIIDYESFIKTSSVLKNLNEITFNEFIDKFKNDSSEEYYDYNDGEFYSEYAVWVHTGLFTFYTRHDSEGNTVSIDVTLSMEGRILLEIFK